MISVFRFSSESSERKLNFIFSNENSLKHLRQKTDDNIRDHWNCSVGPLLCERQVRVLSIFIYANTMNLISIDTIDTTITEFWVCLKRISFYWTLNNEVKLHFWITTSSFIHRLYPKKSIISIDQSLDSLLNIMLKIDSLKMALKK